MYFSGVVMQRWRPTVQDTRCDLEVVLWANHVQVTNEQKTSVLLTPELVRGDKIKANHPLHGYFTGNTDCL